MVVVPAVVAGVLACALVTFGAGYLLVLGVLKLIAKQNTGTKATVYHNTLHPIKPPYWNEKSRNGFPIAGGIVALAVAVPPFFKMIDEYGALAWNVLTVFGIIVWLLGLLVGALITSTETRQKARSSLGRPPAPEPTAPPAASTKPGPGIVYRPQLSASTATAKGKQRPAAPTTDTASPRPSAYRELLAMARGDKALAYRLIEYERRRVFLDSFEELCTSAIQRWWRNNR